MGQPKRYYLPTNKLLLLAINTIFIIAFLLFRVTSDASYNTTHDLSLSFFPWICVLATIQLFCFIIMHVSRFDFMLWYISLSYLFMFGYILQDVFHLQSTLIWSPISSYSISNLSITYSFVVVSLQLICLGYLLAYRTPKSITTYDTSLNQSTNISLYEIGIVLTVLGGVSRLVSDITTLSVVLVANTYEAYAAGASIGLWDDLACLFLPGILCLLFSGKYQKQTNKRIVFLIILYFVIIMLLSGSRKTHLFSILTMLISYLYIDRGKKRNIPRTMVIGLIAILVINFVIVLRDSRYDLSSFMQAITTRLETYGLLGNIFGEIIAETRISVLSIASIVTLVPDTLPFQYGTTFLRTIPSVLPIGWLVGDFFQNASSTNVINTRMGVPAGSSLIGDLYWNYGAVGGAIAAFIIGILISKLFAWVQNNNTHYGAVLHFSLFSQLIMLVRASIFDIFRPVMYFLIIFYLLTTVFHKRGEKK